MNLKSAIEMAENTIAEKERLHTLPKDFKYIFEEIDLAALKGKGWVEICIPADKIDDFTLGTLYILGYEVTDSKTIKNGIRISWIPEVYLGDLLPI